MPAAFRAQSGNSGSSFPVTSVAPAWPSGVQDGDTVLFFIAARSTGAGVPTPPAGHTTLTSGASTSGNSAGIVTVTTYHTGASAPVFTATSATSFAYGVLAFSGVSIADIQVLASNQFNSPQATTWTTPAITPKRAGSVAIGALLGYGAVSVVTSISSPFVGYSPANYYNTNNNGESVIFAHYDNAPLSSISATIQTYSSQPVAPLAVSIVLPPPASGNAIAGGGSLHLSGSGQPRATKRIGGTGAATLGASGQPSVNIAIAGLAGLSLAADGQPRQTHRISTAGQAVIGAMGQPRQTQRIAGEATLTLDGSGRLSIRLHITGTAGLTIDGDGQPVRYQQNGIAGSGGLSLGGAGQPRQTYLIAGDGGLIIDGVGSIISRARIPIAGSGGLALAGGGLVKTWLGVRVSGDAGLGIAGAGQPVMTFPIRGAGYLDLSGLARLTMGNTIRGTGKGRLQGRDNYTGPGTGIHTSHPAPAPGALGGIPDVLLWTLREGDAFRVVIPYGGGSGRTGLARVMSRTINEQGVLSLKLQLVADDAMPPVSAEAVGVGPRIRPDERGNLARRMADSERRIHQLQTAEKLRR